MDDKQLAKLIRKNAAKAAKHTKLRSAKTFDPTLQNRDDEDDPTANDRAKMFKEMKRREF